MQHEIVAFNLEGERILGVIVDHYTNPLDDFYVIYADYALHKVCSLEEQAATIISNVIIPACDEAIADYRVKKQHLDDIRQHHREIEALLDL